MMLTRDTATKFEALDLMLESCIKDPGSHERRNMRLMALRSLLDEWVRDLRRYQDSEDREAKALTTLEAIYQLCIWQLDHETHITVKTRLYMARDLITRFLIRRDEIRRGNIDKRTSQILAKRPTSEEITPVESDTFFEPEAYGNKDITEDLGIEIDSSMEAPDSWEWKS